MDTVEEKAIVAIRPKPPFKPLFEVATTHEGSDVVLMNEPTAVHGLEPRYTGLSRVSSQSPLPISFCVLKLLGQVHNCGRAKT